MKAYFAVGDSHTALKFLGGHRMLISFAYVGSSFLPTKAVPEIAKSASGLMIDSGAFTAWRKGTPINMSAYIEFLLNGCPHHDAALTLDVIGDADASMTNWEFLHKLFNAIVPVWHEGDPIEHLDEYVAKSPLVALGRIEGRRSEQKTLDFYDSAFNRREHAYHALGNANPVQLEPYPFDSFDSTGWQRDAAYSNSAKWPYNRCTKATRLSAYIEATETIEFRKPAQGCLFGPRGFRSSIATLS